MNTKIILIFCLILLANTTSAKKIKLRFEPQGKIIQFNYDSLIIFTDTTSLFEVYRKEGTLKDYDSRVFSFVRGAVENSKSDTVVFNGEFIPFNDDNENDNQKDWYIKWAILHLIDHKRVVIYDKYKNQVRTILTKRVGKKKDDFVKRSYINKYTKEEIIFSTIFIRTVNPSF
jgi:hypothetical protein